MKKIKLVLIGLVILLAINSCNKAKHCYEFTIITVTTSNSDYVIDPITSKKEQCGLTEKEAKNIAAQLTSSSTATSLGIKVTTTATCTYKRID